MWFTILFTLSILSERFLKLDIGILQLSVGDLVVLLSLPLLYFNGGRLPKWTLYISGFVFLSLFISMLLNSGMGINSTISVPLKLVASGIVYYELSNLQQSKVWTLIVGALIIVFSINMVLFTGLGYFSVEIFNRNEMYSYLLGLSCLYLVIYGKNANSKKKFFWVAISIFSLLIVLGFLVQSRQSIISSSILLLLSIIYRINFRNFLPIVAILCIIAGITINPLLKIVSDERFAKRIETITKLDPQTRADMFRLNNALYVFSNFDKAPWFGKGATAFVKEGPYQKVVHNAYLTSLYETGLFGLSVLIGCLWFMLRPMRHGLRNRKILPNSLVLPSFFMMAFIIQALFIEILAKTTFYILLGCAAYLIKEQRLFIDTKKNGKR
jgi:hypothetical protein